MSKKDPLCYNLDMRYRYFFLFLVQFLYAVENTPIKHLIIIFQENRSFDHYFGIYPRAQNNEKEIPFIVRTGTPSVNGFSKALLECNQNLNGPYRLSPSQVDICFPHHDYKILQEACGRGMMDQFVQTTGKNCHPPASVMGYYDGNTISALWNLAQYFAMSDNFHSTVIGQSTAGALNLISGQTHGATPAEIDGFVYEGTVINDLDPLYDMDSEGEKISLSGINVGNLLNAKNVRWGFFQGGFADGSLRHEGPNGFVKDYVPHHNPFQYYASTSNPKHLPPTSLKMVGKQDRANHLYDIEIFWQAAEIGNVPSVVFLRAPAYQDGHPDNSTVLLEQTFLIETINRLQKLPQWKDMAILIAYDDSGGWYDHDMPPNINHSQIPNEDCLTGEGLSGSNPPLGGYQGRPCYGLRVPLLLISPWAKENFVDQTFTDQTSILRFIEENWDLGQIGDFSFDAFAGSIQNMFDFSKKNMRSLYLHPKTGAISQITRSPL